MSSLPPVLVSKSITVNPGHTVIDLVFNQAIAAGSGTIIVTDGALQTVIDRATGLPTTRIVGATDTREISLSSVTFDGSKASISADGLQGGHDYRVFILPGVLTSGGLPFAGVSNGSLLKFTTPVVDTTAPSLVDMHLDNWGFSTVTPTSKLTLTFSEKVTFSTSALHASGLTFSHLTTSDNGVTWQADVTADSGVDVSNPRLTLDMSGVKDLAGNASSGSPFLSYNIDTRLPAIASIALNNATPVLQSGATVTIKFSESVHNLSASAIVAPHAVVGTPTTTDGGITWVASLTPGSGGTSTGNQLYVDLSKVTDLASNAGTGLVNAPVTYAVDRDMPTATISLSGSKVSQKGTVEITVIFSEAVKDVPAGAFTVPNAKLTGPLTSTDGITWTGTLASNASTNAIGNVLKLDMGQVQDMAGNAGSGFAQAGSTYDVDVTPPTASLALSAEHLTSAHGATLTITFSEAVATLDPSWITAQHATLSNLTQASADGSVWTATLTTTDTTSSTGNLVSLDMTKVHDLAGNSGTSSATVVYAIDPAVSSTLPYVTGMIWIDDTGLTYDHPERLTDFITSDGMVRLHGLLSAELSPGQSVQITIGDQHFSADVIGDSWYYAPTTAPTLAPGTYTISVSVVDGSTSSTAYTKTLVIDNAAPKIVSTSADASQDVGQPLVIHFDEPVSWYGVMNEDRLTWNDANNFVKLAYGSITEYVYINQGNLSEDGKTLTIAANDMHLASGTSYTVTLPQALTDTAGNPVDERSITFTATGSVTDTTAPYVVSAMATQQGSFGISGQIEIAVRFNEPVKVKDGVEWPELTLNNGAKATYQTHGANGDFRVMYFLYQIQPTDSTPDGGYLDLAGMDSLLASVTDMAGNKLASTDLHLSTLLYPAGYGGNVTIDTSIPATIALAPQLDSESDTGVVGDLITSDSWPSFHGSGATPGATVVLYDLTGDGMSEIGYATADGDGAWEIYVNVESISDGTHQLAVGQINAVGNPSAGLSPSISLTIDRSPPAALVPTLDAGSDGGTVGDWTTAVTTPTLVISGVEAGATVEILDGTTSLGSPTLGSDGKWSITLPALTSGVHHLVMHQTDVAGNVSEDTSIDLTIDPSAVVVTVPKLSVPHLASDTGRLGNDGITNTVLFKGSGAVANATIELLHGEMVVTSGHAQSDGTWSLSLPAGFADGSYTFTARQTDSENHVSAPSDTFSVTLDTTVAAPSAPLLDAGSDSGTVGDLITSVLTPKFTGSGAESGALIELADGSTIIGSTTANSDGSWNLTLDSASALGNGLHHIAVRQTDLAGNVSALSATLDLTIDGSTPASLLAPTLSAASDSGKFDNDRITNVTTPTFTGSGAEPNTKVELYNGTTLLGTGTSDVHGDYSVAVAAGNALTSGDYHLSVRQVDAAGNASASSPTVDVTIDTIAPTVTGWTQNVLIGHSFEIWFSEQVDHSALSSSFADVFLSPSLFHFSLANGWDDNATRDNHSTSVYSFVPSASGWVELALTGIKDLAGNVATIPLAHYEFTVDFTGTSYFVPPPLY